MIEKIIILSSLICVILAFVVLAKKGAFDFISKYQQHHQNKIDEALNLINQMQQTLDETKMEKKSLEKQLSLELEEVKEFYNQKLILQIKNLNTSLQTQKDNAITAVNQRCKQEIIAKNSDFLTKLANSGVEYSKDFAFDFKQIFSPNINAFINKSNVK